LLDHRDEVVDLAFLNIDEEKARQPPIPSEVEFVDQV